MGQIEQLKKNNKDLKKALDKINGKYSKATQELTAAKLEIAQFVTFWRTQKLCVARGRGRIPQYRFLLV